MEEDDIVVQEDEALKAFLPNGFGKQEKEANVARQLERSKRPRPEDTPSNSLPASTQVGQDVVNGENGNGEDGNEVNDGDNDEDEDVDDDGEEDSEEEDEFPTSHELVLKTHERPITSMTLDPSGSRLITASTD
ncbi:MAG: hypothetical protein Q9174_007028, partial [Haloplaca sp. 1 TL-2023]